MPCSRQSLFREPQLASSYRSRSKIEKTGELSDAVSTLAGFKDMAIRFTLYISIFGNVGNAVATFGAFGASSFHVDSTCRSSGACSLLGLRLASLHPSQRVTYGLRIHSMFLALL